MMNIDRSHIDYNYFVQLKKSNMPLLYNNNRFYFVRFYFMYLKFVHPNPKSTIYLVVSQPNRLPGQTWRNHQVVSKDVQNTVFLILS